MTRMTFGGVLVAATIVALTAAAPAHAQQAPQERLLTVNGEGSATATPDLALITLGVVSEGKTAGEALSANSASMTEILGSLRDSGIEARDLQTSGFSVEPIYSQPPADYDGSEAFEPKIVGYRVHNNVTLRIRDLDRVGALLDQVVNLGANSVSGPTFTVEDSGPVEDEARREAVADAMRKAKLYSEAAGIALGPVFRIEETYSLPPQPLAGQMMLRAAPEADVPIERGELTFQAQVTVSWRLAE